MAGSHVSSPTRNYGQPSITTTFAAETNRGTGKYHVEQIVFSTGTADFYLTAPCAGALARVEVVSLTTTDGSNKIGLTLTNESNSDVAMLATTLFDDSPVATADTATACTLSATAANVLVDQGDALKMAYAETGTIAGGVITLYFEAF